VVTFALLYVAAPSASAMTVTARDGGSAPPGSVVLYGAVQSGTQPIEGARVTVSGNSPGNSGGNGESQIRIVAQESTNAQGTYRLQLYVSPGLYTVDFRLANGSLNRDFKIRLAENNSSVMSQTTDGTLRMSHFRAGDDRLIGRTASASDRGRQDGSRPGGFGDGFGSGFPPGNHFGLVTGQQALVLVPGISYDVSAQLTTTQMFSFLPVTSY